MTDNVRGSLGPPWSVDLLADLHAGVLDQAESERLWPQVNADPDARAILEALDSVKVDLGHLGTATAEPMPAQFAAKLDAALAAEARTRWPQSPVAIPQQTAPPTQPPAQQPAPVTDLAAARKRRNRMAGWGVGVLTAAAAAAAITFVAVPDNTTSGTPDSADGSQNSEQSAQPPLALSSDNLNDAIGLLNGKKDYGPLEDEQGLRACLDQNEIPAADVVGVSPVTFDGQHAVGALFGAGEPGQPGRFRLVVVTEDCEPLAESTLPR